MGPEAPQRWFDERSLGVLDATVGNLLGDPKLYKRITALIEHDDALDRAAHLDATATQKQEQADYERKAERDNAIKDQKARAAKERQVKEARTAADQRKRDSAQDAEKRTAAAKQQADDVAGQRKNPAEAAKREEQAKITRGRADRQLPQLPNPSSKMLSQHAATLQASAHRLTR